MKNIFSLNRLLLLAVLLFACSAVNSAQNLSFLYNYQFEPAMISEPPDITLPDFDYPDDARKHAIDGKASLKLTLGEDGKVRNINVVKSLPNGVSEALAVAAGKMFFRPAKFQGKPVALEMTLELSISMIFEEGDPAIKKPKIILQPAAAYPESERAEKYKGKVALLIIFFADGTSKVNNVSSVLPREFDKAAIEAAKDIKFEPAVHKKSQKPVTQAMTVEFDFKP
jgi:TonB family protein